MNYQEFHEKEVALMKEYESKLKEMRQQYAQEHNPVKVGDVVMNRILTIRVECMTVPFTFGLPEPSMVYYGIELTKEGVPKKKQPREPKPVYQVSVYAINGRPYDHDRFMKECDNLKTIKEQ